MKGNYKMKLETLEKLPFTEFQLALLVQGLNVLETSGTYPHTDQRVEIRSLIHRIGNAKPDGIIRGKPRAAYIRGHMPKLRTKPVRPPGRPPKESVSFEGGTDA